MLLYRLLHVLAEMRANFSILRLSDGSSSCQQQRRRCVSELNHQGAAQHIGYHMNVRLFPQSCKAPVQPLFLPAASLQIQVRKAVWWPGSAHRHTRDLLPFNAQSLRVWKTRHGCCSASQCSDCSSTLTFQIQLCQLSAKMLVHPLAVQGLGRRWWTR